MYCFLFALWGRRVCCLFWKMGIRCGGACEKQRKGLEAEVLNSAPEVQVGLAVALEAAARAKGLGRGLQRGTGPGHPPATPGAWERLLIFHLTCASFHLQRSARQAFTPSLLGFILKP